MKSIVTKEYLQRVCEHYQWEKGFFAKREPVAVFRRPGAVAIVWKQWFTKASGEFVAGARRPAPAFFKPYRCSNCADLRYEPNFFIGAEEALLGLDLVDDGWRLIYAPQLAVRHLCSVNAE